MSFTLFKRRPLYTAEKRRLIKWIDEDYLTALTAPLITCWILTTGFWEDTCTWDDTETWID